MAYFDSFPKINYTIGNIVGSNPVVVRNIFFRVKILDQIKRNTIIYYPYYIKDNETPENIAYKYYNDPSKHWVVLLANNIIDPQFDWPLSYDSFGRYLNAKYGSVTATYNTIHHYEKITMRENNTFGSIPSITTAQIDYNTFINTPAYTFQEINLVDGTTVSITTTTNPVTVYYYENEINENKKNIFLISNKYIDQINNEFIELMKPVS